MYAAAGDRAKRDQRRLGRWPVGGDRIAKMKQRLAEQQQHQQGYRGRVQPWRRLPGFRPVLPGKARSISFFGAGRRSRPRFDSDLGVGFALRLILRCRGWRVTRLGTTQRYRRWAKRDLIELRLVALVARRRSERNERGNAIEHRAAMTAPHSTFAYR